MFVDVQRYLLHIFFIESVLEGADETNSLCEIATKHYLLEEFDLLTVADVLNLDNGGGTYDYR